MSKKSKREEIEEEEKIRAEARAKAEEEIKKNKAKEDSKKLGQGCLVFVLIFVLIIVVASLSGNDEKPELTEEEQRIEMIEEEFSAWDGSHRELTRVIKDTMKDPNSYEHVETTYRDMGDYLIVTTRFRGTNTFGAVVTNSVEAKVSLDGEVIDILSQE